MARGFGMKVVNIVGARPQFVKYFPVSAAIDRFNDGSEERIDDVLIHTGQHYDYAMSKVFFEELGIRAPEYHLGVGSGTQGAQTASVILKTEEVLSAEKPDAVIVYGDTNSTLGGALAAVKLHIPVVHIEAGLRSFNRCMPEEVNRVIVDHTSTYLFCPCRGAVRQLEREGFGRVLADGELADDTAVGILSREQPVDADHPLVANTGDVMYDVLLTVSALAEERSQVLTTLNLNDKKYCLLTIHRAENTDDPRRFRELASFVNKIANGATVIFPMHPRTRKCYAESGSSFGPQVKIIDPLGYFDLLMLLKHSSLVLTDSGGMQKEAFWLSIPCVTLRNETEWIETVESGWNVLFGNYTGTHQTLDPGHVYGDGHAADKIVSVLAAGCHRTSASS
jgi:UDP-GlcNAc3NAcA epimerase